MSATRFSRGRARRRAVDDLARAVARVLARRSTSGCSTAWGCRRTDGLRESLYRDVHRPRELRAVRRRGCRRSPRSRGSRRHARHRVELRGVARAPARAARRRRRVRRARDQRPRGHREARPARSTGSRWSAPAWTPERSAFVGDNPEFDVDPPAALGMFPVLIDRRGRHPSFARGPDPAPHRARRRPGGGVSDATRPRRRTAEIARAARAAGADPLVAPGVDRSPASASPTPSPPTAGAWPAPTGSTPAGSCARTSSDLAERDILLRDAEGGLVDFPAEREGRIVFLCWRLDEDELAFWHEQDSGFIGRRPL